MKWKASPAPFLLGCFLAADEAGTVDQRGDLVMKHNIPYKILWDLACDHGMHTNLFLMNWNANCKERPRLPNFEEAKIIKSDVRSMEDRFGMIYGDRGFIHITNVIFKGEKHDHLIIARDVHMDYPRVIVGEDWG